MPDARMRRGVRIPAWYLVLVAMLGILSRCQSMRDLERFASRHHSALTEALGLDLRRPPSDSAFRYFFQQVDVTALCRAIRDWTIARIPDAGAELDQLAFNGKLLRGSIDPMAGGGAAFIAQGTLFSAAFGVAVSQVAHDSSVNHERRVLHQIITELHLEDELIHVDLHHRERTVEPPQIQGADALP